ncbi:MAG: DNA polymerase-4 [Chitinophagales bacterium]|jgi:DNA polymerase-4
MERSIIHIDLDSFFVSCERKLDSRLEGRPLLIGGQSSRGVVASCSYEARAFGVHSAMPMQMARQLCPEAIVLSGNAGTYSKFSKEVTDIIKEDAPIYEKSSIDEFYIDVSGMDKFFGCYKWSQELRLRIMRETGLPLSFALSQNKTVSKIGTGEAKPNNHKQIIKGFEKPFLAPLSIRKVPQVGLETYKSLREMGIKKIETVQAMPMDLMQNLMGKNGASIWKKCNGIDNSPIIPYNERKSISLERTFQKDTIDIRKLKDIFTAMGESIAYALRKGDKLTSCITVKIRYSDFRTTSKQVKIPYTSCDDIIIDTIQTLFNSLYERRILIRLIGIKASGLVGGGYQINLFNDTEKKIALYQAMDSMRNRYGHKAVMRAVSLKSNVAVMGNPFNGEPPIVPAHRRG